MPPTRSSDEGILLLINNINEQVKRISEAQESLRLYLLMQIDELRKSVIAKDEHRESLELVRRDIATLTTRIDKLETTVTDKIEKVGRDAKDQQDDYFRTTIRVQALVIGFVATTIIGIIVKLYFFH